MSSLSIALVIWVLILVAALVGVVLRRRLREQHLSAATHEFVDRASGLIITISALVLGLLVGSAKNSYDRELNNLKELATDIVVLDHALARYGSETGKARAQLRQSVDVTILHLVSDHDAKASVLVRGEQIAALESMRATLQGLTPANDGQRASQERAVQAADRVIRTSWLLVELADNPVPWVLLFVMVTWLLLIFVGWGLYAPSNGVVHAAMLFCAMVAAGAIFLILEMYDPVAGIIKLPMAPLEIARDHLSR
jgi:hypothetical protein